MSFPASNYPLPTTHCPLPTAHCPLPLSPRPSSLAPRLRLFDPGDGGGSPPQSARLTLGEFYCESVRPGLASRQATEGKSGRYLAEIDTSVRLWRGLTGDPPLAEIDEATLENLVEGLAARVGRHGEASPNTVRKHCRHIQTILDLSGPRPGNRRGRFGVDEDGLPRGAPRLSAPKERIEEPTAIYRLSEIGLWIEACGAAARPRLPGVEPAAWWRALILFVYNTGLRIETAIQVRWTHVSHDRGCWLVVPAALMKGRRRGGKIWLNPSALEAARGLRLEGGRGDERLFAWPLSLRQLHRERGRILAASRIEAARRFGFHAMRRALLTWLTERNPAVAKLQAGHVSGDVTLKHYVDRRIVKRLMGRLPQPSFPAAGRIDPQRRLFD